MSEIKIKTLTPLWTGGINKRCDKIKETGIIGSLRWWYEALVRGLGGYACDPTSDERCPDKNGNICDVCKLFGCTGLKRKFTLRVNNSISKKELIFLSRIEHPTFYYRRRKRDLDFWFKELYESPEAFYGSLNLETISNTLAFSSKDVSNIIKFLLKLIEVGGGLAAKNQLGFGIIRLVDASTNEVNGGFQTIRNIIRNEKKRKISINFPSIRDYIGFEIIFDDIDFLLKNKEKFKWWPKPPPLNAEYYQIGFAIKFLLRNSIKNDISLAKDICKNYDEIEEKCRKILQKIKSKNIKKKYVPSKVIARSIFGSDLEKKWGSLVLISDVWKENGKYKMRIWSFIPKNISYDKIKINENETITFECKIERNQLIKTIQKMISNIFEKVTFSETITGEVLIKKVLENV